MRNFHQFWRHTSGLLLLLYVPIALFMGLQHQHEPVLSPDNERATHTEAPTTQALAWGGAESSGLTDTPYCPACHFQVRSALTANSPWTLYSESRQDLVSYYPQIRSSSLILPFSERAPPRFTV